jgi:catechol 2,3-dioxygenase-like lactoylglutathione lyase family enzyme
MFAKTNAYSGIAVKDLQDARKFYRGILGLPTTEDYGLMWLHLASGRDTLVYEQRNATPATWSCTSP